MFRKMARNFEEILSCTALAIVILSVCWGVITRWLFRRPAAWCDELAAITFTWVVFMGASAAFKRNLHIGVDLLVRSVTSSARRALTVIAWLVILTFCIFMVMYGTIFALNAYKQPTSVLRVPNTFFYMSVPIAFSFMTFHQLRIAARFLFLRGRVQGEL